MKRAGQRGSGRPPIHCDINVEIIPTEEDLVIKFKLNKYLKFRDHVSITF